MFFRVGEVDGNDAGSADVDERRASGRYIGGRPMPARWRSRRVMRRHDAHVPHGLTLLVSHRRGRYGHDALIMAFVGIEMYGHYLDAQRR